MDLAVLPGPSPAELARTAVASARTAQLIWSRRHGDTTAITVRMRAGQAGQFTLLPVAGSPLAKRLTRHPAVTVSVARAPPFRALKLTGLARPVEDPCGQGREGYQVTVQSLRFTGPRGRPVPLARYLAAAPDPLWQHASAMLAHLEHGHMA